MKTKRKRAGSSAHDKPAESATALAPGKRTRVQAHPKASRPEPNSPEPDEESDEDEERTVGDRVPDEVRDRLIEEARRSDRVSSLLDEIEEEDGDDFAVKWSGQGNFHRSGEIHLDRNRDFDRWVPSFMHELSHLADYHADREPDVASEESREDFVNAKMENEIRAQAITYVGLIERERENPDEDVSSPAGYDEFREHLDDEEDDTDSLSADRIEELAKDWLENKYKDDWTTSNTNENYYDYWGNYWDDVNEDD